MVKILVTGGSGFIGRAVCDGLNQGGHDFASVDIAAHPDASVRSYVADIEDAAAIADVFARERPECVIHLAAHASVDSDAWDEFSSIWGGTKVIADAFAAVAPEGGGTFVNISTQLVIGPGEPYAELKSYRPYTRYGEAKAAAEEGLDSGDYPFTHVHIRPTNIWGPYHPSYGQSLLRYLQKRWYLHPVSGQDVLRAYGYVGNTAAQILSVALDGKFEPAEVLYAGDFVSDQAVFLDAMSKGLVQKPVRKVSLGLLKPFALVGQQFSRVGLKAPLDMGRYYRMTTNYPVPLERMHAITPAAAISFDQGIAETVSWYRGTL